MAMNAKIVHTTDPVLLIGGGDCPDMVLHAALEKARCVVAADGGARRALRLGRVPDAIIGDMDSLRPDEIAALPEGVLHPIAEQDSTDFDKCLRNIQTPLVLGYGFLGARLDHELAVLNVLVRRAQSNCVLVGEQDLVLLAPPEITLDLPMGERLSLFPMREVTGRSQGLRWAIDGLQFAPWGQSGTSNEVSGPVTLQFDAPGMLLILPVGYLEQVTQAMLRASAWHVRAE